MALARSCCLSAIWLSIATCMTPAAALASQGVDAVDGPPWSMLAELGLVGLVAAVIGHLWFGDTSQRRRDRIQRARLDRLDLPAAITTADGGVVWANRALRSQGGTPPGSALDLLAGTVEIDAPLLYRIASTARRLGFGAEPVPCRTGGERIVSARLDSPDNLVWALLPADGLSLQRPGARDNHYEDCPFCYLRVERSGAIAGNAMFRETFSAPPDPKILEIAGTLSPDGERVLLTGQDGRKRLYRMFAMPGRSGDGRRRELFIFPITARDALRNGYAAAHEIVPIALVQLDLSGHLLWSNGLAREMIGTVAPGTALSDIVVSLGRPISALIAESATAGRGPREMLRLRASPETFLQITLTRTVLDSSPTILAILTDASELRQLEDKFVQSQKMEAVGKLAGGVAHDFNNVLTAISGHSDLLLLGKDALHPDYSDLIQIRQNTHRAAALVRQLLAFSRKQTLSPEMLPVQDVVSDTQYLLNRLIGERVTLSMDHGRDLGTVRADRQQLEQALMNLVVNARDAMPNGGTITISTRNRHYAEPSAEGGFEVLAGDYVEIAVADEGTGIEPQLIDRVFDPFFTTKPHGEGTGLGLSTVYGIVKQSGGYIFAENRATGGACFRILLPRVEPDSAEAPVARAAPEERRDLTGNGAILLVEDEDPVRSFAMRALRMRGYEVLEAGSAEEAMEIIDDSSNRIDLLVSDVVMPGTDGPTLAGYARQRRPGLPVVFVSGYAEDSFRRNLVDHDFMFLPKPFSLVDLTAKVKEALGTAVGPRAD